MGCFSFLCKKSGKPAYSTSFGGSPCHLFLLKDGKVLEHMYGNYDSYGRVFNGKDGSFEWQMDWQEICNLMFNDNPGDGMAMILDRYYKGVPPTEQSEDDPEQGWGYNGRFREVEEPFHKIYDD